MVAPAADHSISSVWDFIYHDRCCKSRQPFRLHAVLNCIPRCSSILYNKIMEISPQQQQGLDSLLYRFKLTLVIAYGSQVSTTQHKDSDLDIAVMVQSKPDYELFKNLYSELSTIFKGTEVDMHFLNEADPLYMMQVVKDGQLLAGTQDDFDDLKMLTNRRYVDDGIKYFPAREELLKVQQQRLRSLDD